MKNCSVFTAFLLSFALTANTASSQTGSVPEVLDTMRKASEFMMDTVSNRGGFLWRYSEDLSEFWGEVPARESQIWVQDPATVGVGEVMLEAYQATGDNRYLEYARRVADVLIYGQHPAGGWHYFIDFDMPGVEKWYEEVASRCWGWEEYYYYYGNCTFDDEVTTGATRFLLNFYMTTLEPAYRIPLVKALDFILEAQYPNGAWPQRYPVVGRGHYDYTHYYTFNDDVIQGNIHLLLEAWERLGDDRYRKAALRGMDFVIISQLPAPQAGWGQQYDLEMNSAAARNYEPASVMPGQTISCIRDLMTFFKITGNRKYLRGIPDAIKWLEDSVINTDTSQGYTHATFYELGTNKPLFAHRTGPDTNIDTGYYWVDYNFGRLSHYGSTRNVNIDAIRKEFERVYALTPEEAQAEYQASRQPRPAPRVTPETVRTLSGSLDSRGAWITSMTIANYDDPIHGKRRDLDGIHTAVFIRNMRTLTNFISNQQTTR